MRPIWISAMLAVLGASAARAEGQCQVIDEPIMTMYSGGCGSPVGICTVGTAGPGALSGTTAFTALTVRQPTPDMLLYTGQLVVTTSSGTVTIHDHGILNTTTGEFFEIDQVVSGTGAYAGARGLLTTRGMATGIGFSGTLTGRICNTGAPAGAGQALVAEENGE